MESILTQQKQKKFRADRGSEFVNRWFKKLMKDEDIYFFTTQNPAKANLVERVQRTIKSSLYRMMRRNRSYRYIDSLENIVSNYNNTPHRGLNGLTPMHKTNEADVWAYMYLKKKPNVKTKPVFTYKVGDLVRISFTKQPFRRAYQEQFTTEVFRGSARVLKQGISMYKLQDLKKRQNSRFVLRG